MHARVVLIVIALFPNMEALLEHLHQLFRVLRGSYTAATMLRMLSCKSPETY